MVALASPEAIDEDMDGYSNDVDCNDQNSAINLAADEICDGFDNNCDGAVDDNEHNAPTWYADVDADGYGTGGRVASQCTPADGYVGKDGDCNDADRTVSPLAKEIHDGKDNDCDGEIDEPKYGS